MTPITKDYPVTPADIARIKDAASTEGIDLSRATGTINKDGVTASYILLVDTLSVTLLSKPFFLSTDTFFEKLEATLKLTPES
jgi:hypothetical protein